MTAELIEGDTERFFDNHWAGKLGLSRPREPIGHYPDESSSNVEHSRGDLDFEMLFRRYERRIRAVAMSRLRDRHLADDVVQETLLRAFRYRSAHDSDKPAWPWLFRIAVNVCTDIVTREARDLNSLPVDFSDPAVDVYAVEADVADKYSDREVLLQVLESMPPLHRRILLLSAEGWSYRDIAALEGLSFFALQSALQRARRRFRSVYEKLATGGRTFPAIVFLPHRLREIFDRARAKTRTAVDQIGQVVGNSPSLSVAVASHWSGKLEHLIALILVALLGTSVNAGLPSKQDPSPPEHAPVVSQQLVSSQVPRPPSLAKPAFNGVPINSGEITTALGLDDIDPGAEEEPEDATLGRVVVSPNYATDHTLYASGCAYFRCNLLFVSRDGGASWNQLPAIGFVGPNLGLMLPPTYPSDDRIFSTHYMGLQESRDGGKTFVPLVSLPLVGTGAAISPRFGRGDSLIYLSTVTGMIEYDRELNTIRSSSLPLPIDGELKSFAVSPTQDDPIVLVAMYRNQKHGEYIYNERHPYRCQRGACEKVGGYNGFYPLKFRYSSGFAEDQTIYLVSSLDDIFVSSDRGKTFASYPVPKSQEGLRTCCNDLVALPGTLTPVWIGTSWASFGGVYRSNDLGASWAPSPMNLPRDQVPVHLSATPTGRVLATGWRYGIACSEDGGVTWAPRCTPE